MSLTIGQLQTLKTDIAADSILSLLPQTGDGAFEVAAAYNLQASPDYTVWRNGIETKEVKRNVDWNEYIVIGTGERAAFELMISNGIIDAGDVNIRQGFQDVFSGAAQATTRNNMVAMAKRLAIRIEALLAVGTGSPGSPGEMTHEGPINHQTVLAAWSS